MFAETLLRRARLKYNIDKYLHKQLTDSNMPTDFGVMGLWEARSITRQLDEHPWAYPLPQHLAVPP
jgi:hypothetical protein